MNQISIHNLSIVHKKQTLVDLSFEVNSTLAIIGESGSGKSLTIKSLLDLLPKSLKLTKEINSSFELSKDTIGFVPQNPFTSLSPLTLIDKQFFCSKKEKVDALKLVGLDESLLKRYPMELSGGQLQRVVIAISLINNPNILLLDEPTTALDKKTKDEILSILKNIVEELNLLMIFVTHDISVIENLCEDIIILKKGKIVERGKTKMILKNPKDEYTKKLISSTFKNRGFRA